MKVNKDAQNDAGSSAEMLQILTLPECDNIIKNEFEIIDEEDGFLTDDIKFPFGDLADVLDTPKKCTESRKNKRKTLTPQRAVQSGNGQSSTISESDITNDQSLDSNKEDLSNDLLISDTDLADGEELLRDIDEEDIFRGIQEEADGEKLDDEIVDNVKEEWRSHWGIKCNMCEKVFSYKTEFDSHYIGYGLAPVYTCSFCNKTAEKYTTFRSHCYRHITEGRYKCTECNKGFSLQSMLHVHTLSKHTKAKPYSCEECGKSFVTKPGLKIHIRKHKSDVKEDYPCFLCGKVLHTRGGLTSHINVHRLGRRFMCDICGKTFTQKVNMQQHAKQHTGDKPYACDKCDKTFAEKSHLARHYSFHSNYRPFKCEVCSKMYKTERCLKVHSMVHSEARPFVCTYCNKGFLSSTKLKQHYNVHTGERPYACKYCERKFTNYPNWLKHTRRRHKVDHKTGEQLEIKPKEEESQVSAQLPPVDPPTFADTSCTSLPVQTNPQPLPNIQATPHIDSLGIDLNLLKAEDLFMQQQNDFQNIPLGEEKMLAQQDLFSTNGITDHFIVSHFPNQMPNQQVFLPNNLMLGNTQFPMQFSEFVTTNFLPCE